MNSPYMPFVRLNPAATQKGRRGLKETQQASHRGSDDESEAERGGPSVRTDRARFSGVVMSAMYANAVTTLADVTPEIIRPTINQPIDGAIAMTM
jgi:hypothetical protein